MKIKKSTDFKIRIGLGIISLSIFMYAMYLFLDKTTLNPLGLKFPNDFAFEGLLIIIPIFLFYFYYKITGDFNLVKKK